MVTARLVPPRFGSVRHPDRPTLGGILADLARSMGVAPFPWQRLVGDVSLELVPRRGRRGRGRGSRLRLGASSVGVMASRQTGKTSWAAARVALQCMLPELAVASQLVGLDGSIRAQRVGFTAQDRIGALGRWYEHVDLVMGSPLRESVERLVRKNGEECLYFHNGSSYRVITPSRTGARGLSLDLVIIDEALAHTPELLAAMRPTMAQRDGAVGCIGTQLVLVSNAGDERSTLLNDQRELGRRAALEGETARVWFEWSAPDDCDPYDEATWRATIPTLGVVDGIGLDFLRSEAESMRLEDFRREYLCVHTVRPEADVIDADAWGSLPRDELSPTSRVVLAADAAPDGSQATIVVAGEVGDVIAVEVVAQGPGTAWVASALTALAVEHGAPVVLDSYGPLSSIVAVLERATGVRLRLLRVRDVIDAAADFCDRVSVGGIAHMRDPRLDEAVFTVGRRKAGDRWAFDRGGEVDVSALVAASLAVRVVAVGSRPVPAIH